MFFAAEYVVSELYQSRSPCGVDSLSVGHPVRNILSRDGSLALSVLVRSKHMSSLVMSQDVIRSM